MPSNVAPANFTQLHEPERGAGARRRRRIPGFILSHLKIMKTLLSSVALAAATEALPVKSRPSKALQAKAVQAKAQELKHFDGVVSRAENQSVTVERETGEPVTFAFDQVSRAHLKFEW